MSLFQQIKRKISRLGRSRFLQDNDREILEIIKNETSEFLVEMLPSYRGQHKGKLRKTIDIPGSLPEAIWERLLTNAIPNACNQNNFLSGILPEEYDGQVKHMNVDLVLANENRDEIFSFIELKIEADEPFWALCELLMYFFLFRAVASNPMLLPRMASPVNLIVLAPSKYYETSPIPIQLLKDQALRLRNLINGEFASGVCIKYLIINKTEDEVKNRANWSFAELVREA